MRHYRERLERLEEKRWPRGRRMGLFEFSVGGSSGSQYKATFSSGKKTFCCFKYSTESCSPLSSQHISVYENKISLLSDILTKENSKFCSISACQHGLLVGAMWDEFVFHLSAKLNFRFLGQQPTAEMRSLSRLKCRKWQWQG